MNPFAPPTSDLRGPESIKRSTVALAVLGLTSLQLLWLLLNISTQFELVQTGSVSLISALSGLLGCAMLYVGALRFAITAIHGTRIFVAAFVFLAFSLKGWGIQYFWSFPYIAGVAISIAGWWFSKKRATAD